MSAQAVAARITRPRLGATFRVVLLAALALGLTVALLGGSAGDVLNAGLVAATFRYATPIVFAALGGILSERSGIVNIGLEGMMLGGAFFGLWGAYVTGSWPLGILLAVVAGGVLALAHAAASVTLRANQIVSGLAVNLLAVGLTGFLFRTTFSDIGAPPGLQRIPDVRLESLPGPLAVMFDGQNLLVWVMFLLVPAVHFLLYRTVGGLRLRAVGESPGAAATAGISVTRIRYLAVVGSGMIAALGGCFLSLGFVGTFTENMTAGRGFIALAAVIFGGWTPRGAFLAALLFGGSTALAQRLQLTAGISADLLSIAPYALTLIALVGLVGRHRAPRALGQPYPPSA